MAWNFSHYCGLEEEKDTVVDLKRNSALKNTLVAGFLTTNPFERSKIILPPLIFFRSNPVPVLKYFYEYNE